MDIISVSIPHPSHIRFPTSIPCPFHILIPSHYHPSPLPYSSHTDAKSIPYPQPILYISHFPISHPVSTHILMFKSHISNPSPISIPKPNIPVLFPALHPTRRWFMADRCPSLSRCRSPSLPALAPLCSALLPPCRGSVWSSGTQRLWDRCHLRGEPAANSSQQQQLPCEKGGKGYDQTSCYARMGKE